MKHLLPVITLILMLTASTQAMGQETYTIKSIQNAQSIAIGNRQKKVNDTFKGTDRIVFTNKKECLVLKKEGSSRDLYVNEEVMKARNAQTLDELFAKKGRRKGTNNRDKTYTPGAGRGYSGNTPEIAQGVDTGGAGDQGIMIGYASDETPELLPREVVLLRRLNQYIYEK